MLNYNKLILFYFMITEISRKRNTELSHLPRELVKKSFTSPPDLGSGSTQPHSKPSYASDSRMMIAPTLRNKGQEYLLNKQIKPTRSAAPAQNGNVSYGNVVLQASTLKTRSLEAKTSDKGPTVPSKND